jgi:hypothetical protein
MSKITSEKQAAANRANSTHSTGPRTAEGKSTSARNATSHGLYAATIVVHHWESKADFDRLREEYLNRFRPIDRAESDIVDRLVDSTWRRNRTISIETTLIDLEIEEMNEEIERKYLETEDGLLRVALAFRKRHAEGVWDVIARHLAAADRAYQRALRDLRLLQAERFNVMSQHPAECTAEMVEMTERSQPIASEPKRSAVVHPGRSVSYPERHEKPKNQSRQIESQDIHREGDPKVAA